MRREKIFIGTHEKQDLGTFYAWPPPSRCAEYPNHIEGCNSSLPRNPPHNLTPLLSLAVLHTPSPLHFNACLAV